MREKNRKTIASIKKLPQFTTMNVIDGQAGLVNYSSLIFYSLTIDNILNIIVLLILAGVTINLTLGENGIFRTAEQAGRNYTQAQEQELAGLANFENTINNIIAGTGNSGGNGTDTPELPENALKRIAKPGDYVKYDTGIDGIGDNKDGIVLFRVLYNDDTNGLQIILDEVIERVSFGSTSEDYAEATASYNGAIEELNNYAEKYVNSKYALDGRCVGSAPRTENGIFVDKDKVKFEGTAEYVVPTEENYYTLKTFTNENYINSYATDINYEEDQRAMQAIGGDMWDWNATYWLASREVTEDTYGGCYFSMRYVGNDLDFFDVSELNWAGYVYGNSPRSINIRPCISLNPNVKVVGGGDGSEKAQAYELGI